MLAAVMLLTFAYAAVPVGCAHSYKKYIEETGPTYENIIDGHYVIMTTIYQCTVCGEYVYDENKTFEGHTFTRRGDIHVDEDDEHWTYYECHRCLYWTVVVNKCYGPPCKIIMGVDGPVEVE